MGARFFMSPTSLWHLLQKAGTLAGLLPVWTITRSWGPGLGRLPAGLSFLV